MALIIKDADMVAPAYLKMGIMGEAGAGKSKTASKIAIGLVKRMQAAGIDTGNKPVLFHDTEDGVGYVAPDFEKAGVELKISQSKAFADLLDAMRWAEANASVLIIDSITHPWRELIASYLKKKQRTFLQIDDWSYLKGAHGWAQFSDFYVNSKLHIIMCGRAGDDLEQYTDENGKRQLEKVGVKMKTETETGFEPSLLVLMEKKMDQRTKQTVHLATVMKDRADRINGEQFEDPEFSAFLPHIEVLRLGGAHTGVPTGDSQHILKTEKRDWQPVQRKIVLDEIKGLFVLEGLDGTGAAEKKKRTQLLLEHFNALWTEMDETMSLPELRAGYDSLHRALTGKPSKYGSAVGADTAAAEINDALPDHSAPPVQAAEAPAPSLEQQLVAQLETLNSTAELAHWAQETAKMDIEPMARVRLSSAMIQRSAAIAAKPEPEQVEEKPAEPKPAKTKKQKAAAEPIDAALIGG